MFNFLPLAHGELGLWDELLPIIIIGVFFTLIFVIGFISRRNENNLDGTANEGTESTPRAEQADETDHVRLS
jgi:hypothetical protein